MSMNSYDQRFMNKQTQNPLVIKIILSTKSWKIWPGLCPYFQYFLKIITSPKQETLWQNPVMKDDVQPKQMTKY